jgi:hypothetical protein
MTDLERKPKKQIYGVETGSNLYEPPIILKAKPNEALRRMGYSLGAEWKYQPFTGFTS